MKIWIIPVALATIALTACFSRAPEPENLAAMLKPMYEKTGGSKISQVTVTNMNCSQRESSYFCEFDAEVRGTYRKLDGFVPGTITPKFADAPFEQKRRHHMNVAKGDKGWMEVIW